MNKLNLSYLSVNSAKPYAFYMIPKELFKNELFDSLDTNSKVLYGFMLDRSSLSATNPDFIDANGHVYIIYTVEQIKEDLRCSNSTAMKMLKQLEGIGLIQRRIRGQGKAAITYVMDFSTAKLSTDGNKNTKKQNDKKKYESFSKNRMQNFQKIERNHTNQKNHTDLSETDLSIQADPVDNSPKSNSKNPDLRISNNSDSSFDSSYNQSLISQYLNFDTLKLKFPEKQRTLLEIEHLINKVFNSREQTFRIGKKPVEAYNVRHALRSIGNMHIVYILGSLDKNTSVIKNKEAYLLTMLYNASKQSFIDVEIVKNVVKTNINLDSLLHHNPYKQKEILEMFNIIVETLASHKKTYRIARGEIPAELVKANFASLKEEHINFVLNSFNKNTSEIKSIKAYIQTALYNSQNTIETQLSLDVRRSLYEHLGISI